MAMAANEIEALIKQHFSTIPKASSARPRIEGTVPDNAAPLVAIAKDPEAQGSSVELDFKMPKPAMKTSKSAFRIGV